MSIILDLRLAKSTLEKCSRINSRRRVPLKINEIAGLIAIARPKEMIESNFKDLRRRRVTRDMAAQLAVGSIGTHHQRQRNGEPGV